MTTKPGTLPRWADISLNFVEPSSGKKDQGWVGGEQPPAQYLNWLINLIYQWTQYLNNPDGFTLGADLLATEANANIARITAAAAADATAQYTLLASLGDARIWIGSSTRLAIVLTYNASRTTDNTDKWEKITASQPALAVYIGRASFRVCSMPLAQNTAWSEAFVEGEGTSSGWGSIFNFITDSESETNAESDVAQFVTQMPVTSGTERKLLFLWKKASTGHIHVYYTIDNTNTDANGLEIVFNAKWSNTDNLWTYQDNGMAFKVLFSSKRFEVKAKASGTAGTTFADSAWTNSPLNFQWLTTTTDGAGDENKYDLSNGRIRFLNPQTEQADDANPLSTLSTPSNSICAKSIVKGWANVNELTTGPVIISSDGLNISSVTHDTTAETITVNFGTDFDGLPCITFGSTGESGSGDFLIPKITAYSGSSFTVRFLKITEAGVISVANLGTDEFDFMFHATGQQNA